MKTQRMISIKMVVVLFCVSLLAVTACNSKQENPTKEKEQSAVAQTNVNPPSMDIHAAAFMGNVKAIRQHIEAGSDLNKKDQYGSTSLMIATTFGKREVAQALIEGGADLNCTNNEGSTALHAAAFFCRTGIVKALLEKDADKTVKNNFGSTALETVAGPFSDAKGIYDQISKDLGPLGFKLDYAHVEITRPEIAELLR